MQLNPESGYERLKDFWGKCPKVPGRASRHSSQLHTWICETATALGRQMTELIKLLDVLQIKRISMSWSWFAGWGGTHRFSLKCGESLVRERARAYEGGPQGSSCRTCLLTGMSGKDLCLACAFPSVCKAQVTAQVAPCRGRPAEDGRGLGVQFTLFCEVWAPLPMPSPFRRRGTFS